MLINFKKRIAFTLVELIIVIAIISILSGILVIAINPSSVFANARNSQRYQDLTSIQSSINRYLAESQITGVSRNINDISGYNTLYFNAINNLGGKCSNGVNVVTTSIPGAFTLDNITTSTSLDLSPVINNNYLPKVPKDPINQINYKACIDTFNGNQLVVYADNTEGQLGFITAGIGSYKGNIDLNSSTGGLVGYWNMDEAQGSIASDSSGNNNTGTATGTTIISGKFSNSRSFNGTTDYINVGNSNSLSIRGAITLSAWIYSNGAQLDHAGIINSRMTATAEDFSLATIGNSILFEYNNGTSWSYPTTGNRTFTNNSWNHVLVTRDSTGSQIKYYINGSLTFTDTGIGLSGGFGTLNRIIGADLGYPGAPRFNGKIDEVRVYNKALSATEVSALYNYAPGPIAYYNFDGEYSTTLTDRSGNNNTGIWSGTGSHWTTGKYGSAGNFNGTDDYISIQNSITLQSKNISIGAWIYPISFDNTYSYREVIRKEGAGGWEFSNRTYSNLWDDGVKDSNGNPYSVFFGTQYTPLNQWSHMELTYNGSIISVYINGVLVSTQTMTGDLVVNNQTIYIGSYSPNSRPWWGQIDEVKIYNYARTSSQILGDMN